ncbi:hypothetical protein GCM10011585_10100 [Edaphobacter dinghuensis]|uniref:Bacterial Ig-like domain-containing protein n=2 Tax=Edaphobacter dinghuensis TaxID=1560005 RepID=A0A917H7B2_9BACT|nr:hypothetical protein GCM10011585_10100 [Edaphobacter dinghuensis]
MKKILLSLFLVLSCVSAHAKTWYIRTDGGTATQCTGLVNAAYSGSGTAQPCAYNHPFYLVTNNVDTTPFAWKIAGGDTVQFEDVGPYYIGQGFNGLGQSWLACASDNLDCVLPNLPAGTAGNPTRFLGKNAGSCHTAGHTGTLNPTQWIGLNGDFWMLSIQNTSYVDVECFDFTQPDQCSMGGTGFLPADQVCSNGVNNYVKHGLMLSYLTGQGPSNSTVSDLSIHGLSNEAVSGGKMNQSASDVMNLSDIYIYGNGGAGFDSDAGNCGNSCESVGTVNINHWIVNWNGCVEVKPNGGTIGGNGYTDCTDQSHSGYGDGFTMIAEGNSTWNVSDISVNWNTQDGFDGLHMGDDPTTNPVVNITRLSAQGNMGQQLKTGGSIKLTNSWFNGNCRRLSTPFAPNPNGYNAQLGDFCRAGPISIAIQLLDGRSSTIENNTSVGYSQTMWAFLCVEGQTCSTATQVVFLNNLNFGINDPDSGDNPVPAGMYFGESPFAVTDPFANQGSSISHNLWYGVRGAAPFGTCPQDVTYETNAVCANPKLVAETDYDNINPALTASSPAIGAGIPITGMATDFADASRPVSNPSIGAFEYGSGTGGTTTAPTSQPATVTLSVPSSTVTAGQPVTLSATLAVSGSVVPTGTVSFMNGSTSLGTATLSNSGTATLSLSSLAAGNYTVTAVYSGDSHYGAGTSNAVAVTVSGTSSTTPPPVTGTPPPVTGTPPPVTSTPPPVTSSPPPVTGSSPGTAAITISQPNYGFNVIPGSTRRVFATATNATSSQITWSVKSGSAQISSTTGPWVDVTAPATGSSCSYTGTSAQYGVSSSTQFTIEAALAESGAKVATATFNVCNPTVEVSVVPFYRALYANQPADVQSLVLGAVNQNVHWAITSQPKGGDGKLTDSASRDTLFVGTVPGRYELTATSVANTGKSATAILYVTGHKMPYRVTPNLTEPVDCSVDPSMQGAVYEVGPSQTFKTLASVPFPTMLPGSTVRLHNEDKTGLNPTTYHEYVEISQPATAEQPFRLCGVPDASGHLPIIDGTKATGRPDTSTDIAGYGLLTLHNSDAFAYWPKFIAAQYIVVEGIQFRDANPVTSYTAPTGSSHAWQSSAACIHISEAQNVTFVGNDIGSCGNGVLSDFNSNAGWGASDVNVLWEGNNIHNNGIAGSNQDHQMYLQSWNNIVQFNRIDNYTKGALGANIKSRGLNDIIRYNYLGDGTQREMDLVDVKDAPAYMSFTGFLSGGTNSFHALYSKDSYPADRIAAEQEAWNSHFVYGNIYQNSTSAAPIHFSMDTAGGELARKGSLYWYNNTFYQKACTTCSSVWTLFDTTGGNGTYFPQAQFQTVQAYNNVIWMDSVAKPYFEWNNYSAFIGVGGGNLLTSNWGSDLTTGGTGTGWSVDSSAVAYQGSLPLDNHLTGFDKNDIKTSGSIPFDRTSWTLGTAITAVQSVPSAVCEMPTRFAYLPNLGYAVPRTATPNVGATDTIAETAELINQAAGSGRYNTRYSNCH